MNLTGYYPPGVLGSQSYSAGPLSRLAYQLAGSPSLGPFADRGSPPAVPNISAGASGPGTGGGAGSTALGILGSLAKNPSLVKGAVGLLGGGLGAYGSGAAADAAVTGALGSVGAQTAGDAAAIAAANDAALGGAAGAGAAGTGSVGAGAGATATGSAGAGAGAAGTGALSAAGALAGVALPLALAALVPYNAGLSIGDVNSMEQAVAQATKANGGPLSAEYAMNPDGTVNQGHSQVLDDLYTLIGDNPDEFTKAGGQDRVVNYLTQLGYGGLLGAGTPITAPAPGGRGWLGGNSRGTQRK